MKNFVKLNIFIMSFRNHKFRPSAPTSRPVVEQTLKTTVIDGVDTFTRVDVNVLLNPPLPPVEDYRLSALLAAGAPLTPVSPTIFQDIDADSDAFLNQILTSDVTRETENDSDSESETKEVLPND